MPIRRFLGWMLRRKEVIAFYNRSEGLEFPNPKRREMEETLVRTVNAVRVLEGREKVGGVNRTPTSVLPIMEDFLARRALQGPEADALPSAWGALILDYVEAICPNNDLATMSSEDRFALVTLLRWASDPLVLKSDNIVILVTSQLSAVHRRIISNPQVCPIEVPLPGEEERHHYLEHLHDQYDGVGGLKTDAMARITAGLGYLQIDGLFRQARDMGDEVTHELVSETKRRIIEHECQGLIEFMRSSHDFSHVGGLQHIKDALDRVVENMRRGATNRVPMGILFVGPMGTGKTFVAEAFANESGMTCIKLKNFRDKWVGSTEANLEKILGVIKAMGNVAVVIDEGDRAIGGGESEDSGVSSRVIARLKEFMADTSHRGSVIFIMMTNRPDKLDADMKRAGRFDLKLPFFAPHNTEDRLAVTRALIKKNKLNTRISDWDGVAESMEGMSGAEIEAILLNSQDYAEEAKRKLISEQDVLAAVHDFIPSRDSNVLRLMELLAVFECSSRRLLPERFQGVDTAELNQQLRRLKATQL